MNAEEIRQRCREEFARRHRENDEDTLVTCPGCSDAPGLVRVDTDDAGSYCMFTCPWCDGRCVTTAKMIALYRQLQS